MSSEQARSAGHDVQHQGLLARIGRWCANNPWWAIAIWVVAALGIGVTSKVAGGTLVDKFDIPNSDAQRAVDLLQQRFPARAGDSATLVFATTDGGKLTDPKPAAAIGQLLAGAAKIPHVTGVGNPLTRENGALSDDGTIAYADVQFDKPAFELDKAQTLKFQETASELMTTADAGVRVEFTGQVIQATQTPENGTSELIGLVAAMIILLIVFGTFTAMLLPILLAILAVGLGAALLLIFARFTSFNTITPVLASMIGLGVGIDYSLFIVTRFRQAMHDGLDSKTAAAVATATAGRAVIFAGLTVAISISALAVVGLDFITKLGFGAAITVIVAVIAATTLLPAVLSLLGHRVDRLRVPFVKPQDDSHEARQNSFFTRWAKWVTRHAVPVALIPTIVLAVLALPAIGWVHLGSSDAGSGPKSSTTRQAYDLLAEGFGPGFNGPLLVAIAQRKDPGAAARLADAIKTQPGVDSVSKAITNDAKDTAQVIVFPTTAPDSEKTKQLVEHLRNDVIPASIGSKGAVAYVGGSTAAFDDIATRILGRFPLFLLVAMGITFLILTMAFRSVVVALKASITTVLSAMAAAGVLVAVFQFGWGISLIGLDRTGPIESFLPVIVFAILFGLSMDYEVFLVSRIREEYVHGDSPRQAIIDGVGAIGRVVAAAAAIMTVVFFAFILGPDRTIKEFGVALGAAIVFDAFLVRLMIVPAVMHLLDKRAWYIPAWLDRLLPNLTIEPPHETHDAPTADPVPASS